LRDPRGSSKAALDQEGGFNQSPRSCAMHLRKVLAWSRIPSSERSGARKTPTRRPSPSAARASARDTNTNPSPPPKIALTILVFPCSNTSQEISPCVALTNHGRSLVATGFGPCYGGTVVPPRLPSHEQRRVNLARKRLKALETAANPPRHALLFSTPPRSRLKKSWQTSWGI
jgi:hypothetical protein